MARRNLDWHVGWWSDELLVADQSQQVVLTLVTSGELLNYEDDVIVERVVGQLLIINSGTEVGLACHARLAVRPENESAIFTLDMTLPDGAEEPFMWHKVLTLGPGGSNMLASAHPEWSHIDCRVNRKLEGLDRLVLCLETIPALVDGEAEWRIGAWIRVLLKT